MTATAIISTRGLTKAFGPRLAVADLNLTVNEGDVFGFLGPNGSGKTTTLRMLLGLVYATSGTIELFGHRIPRDASLVLGKVGALIEGPGFYPHRSGPANLDLVDSAGSNSGRDRKSRIDEALERVGLADSGRLKVGAYSTGMRQRLALAAALLRRPRLLVLDEPTAPLDPHGARSMRDLIAELASDGVTVLLSSHLLSEVETICNRAAIVDRGRLVAQDEVARLLAPTGQLWITTPDLDKAETLLRRAEGPNITERTTERLALDPGNMSPDAVNELLVCSGVRVLELTIERATLEDIFLRLTADGRDVDDRG